MEESLDIDGYTVHVAVDEASVNPFEDFDCEPPLLTFYDGGLAGWSRGERDDDSIEVASLVARLPDKYFRLRKFREPLIDLLRFDVEDFDRSQGFSTATRPPKWADEWRESIVCKSYEFGRPSYWSEAEVLFEILETLAGYLGIPCFNGVSRGYCQGDASLVLALATPEWRDLVGCSGRDRLSVAVKYAFDLYSAWAWGDVYYIRSIADPTGAEVTDISGGSFYGRDHEQSGLLETAREAVTGHKEYLVKEAAEAFDAACRDIVTTP